jgi:hypothetical protein
VPVAGRYPEIAYQTAFALDLMLQIAAGVWFGSPWLLQAFKRNLRFLRAPNAPAKYDSCR